MKAVLAVLAVAIAAPVASAQAGPDQWNVRGVLPRLAGEGGTIVATDPDTLYVTMIKNLKWFYRYKVSTDTWTLMELVPEALNRGACMTYLPSTGHIYLLTGSTRLYRYSLATGHWNTNETPAVTLSALKFAIDSNAAMTATSDRLYVLGGSSSQGSEGGMNDGKGFFEFDPALPGINGAVGAWTWKAPTTWSQNSTARGCAGLAWPGGDFVYAMAGSSTRTFWRYSLPTNAWSRLGDVPEDGGRGSSLVAGPPGTLALTNGSAGRGFFRFTLDAQGGGSWSALPLRPGLTGPGAGMAYLGGDDETFLMTRGELIGPGTFNHPTSDLWRFSKGAFPGLAPAPGLIGVGGAMTGVGDGDDLYVLAGGDSRDFHRYSMTSDAWTPMNKVPAPIGAGGSLAYVGGDFIYATGNGDAMWRYSLHGANTEGQVADTWVARATLPRALWSGGRIAWDGADGLVALVGMDSDTNTRCYRYTISEDRWNPASIDTPDTVLDGSCTCLKDGRVYAFRGGGQAGFWAFDSDFGQWNTPFNPADSPKGPGPGGSLGYAGSGDEIHCLTADDGGGTAHWGYAASTDSWTARAPLPATVGAGGASACPGRGKYLYALQGYQSASIFRYWMESAPPEAPTLLRQRRLDGSVEIRQGDPTSESGFTVQARISDPFGDPVSLEVELKPVGTDFDGTGLVTGPLVPSGSMATVRIEDRVALDLHYHWRARTVDAIEVASAWCAFGTNADPGDTDLYGRSNHSPAAPSLEQLAAMSGTPLAAGARLLDREPVLFRATTIDPDPPGDDWSLEVEVRPVGSAFTGVATLASDLSASGSAVSLTGRLGPGGYHWQARAQDRFGAFTAWVPFGDGRSPDFEVTEGGSLGGSSCLNSTGSRAPGAWTFLVLAGFGVSMARRIG